MKCQMRWPAKLVLSLGVMLGTVLPMQSVQAAEALTMIIGPINRSITLSDLEDLAENGRARGDLRTVLNIADLSPEQASEFLQKPISFDLVTAARILYSTPGEAILKQLGSIIAPRHVIDDPEVGAVALRSAVILSLSGDNSFTPLELVENYPTKSARVNVDELLKADDQFGSITDIIQNLPNLN
jgi:hypothetical protein